jgi:hypothetical protein
MGMNITVTREPRLNLQYIKDVEPHKYCWNPCGGQMIRTVPVGYYEILFETQTFEDHAFHEDFVHVFQDFEAMCKWVAGGRKLEDLQGDGKDEWIPALAMQAGSQAVVVHDPDDAKFVGVPLLCCNRLGSGANLNWIRMDTWVAYPDSELVCKDSSQQIMVWPLKPGDSITITPQE